MRWTQQEIDYLKIYYGNVPIKEIVAYLNRPRKYYSYQIRGKRARKIIDELKEIDVPKLERKWGI